MSLTTSEMTPADFAAVTGNNNDGWGDGNGWWLILLFLFAFNGGWGNGFGGNAGGGNGFVPYYLANNTDNGVQAGFNNAALASQLTGIQNSVTNGFSSAEIANCGRAADAMQTAYTNQIATMNQNFANQQALDARLGSMEMAQQNCCCENRAGLADLKYTVATEACADRNAISSALRDVIESNTASTQRILDQMCQDKIDAKNEKIQSLENQLNIANLQASQTAQTARLLSDNAAQTTALEQYLNPAPIPAYVVQNPNCCPQNNCGCNL